MPSFRQIVLLALPLLSSVACQEPVSPTKREEGAANQFYANANEHFQDLLNAIPEESLHAALNSLSHFRAGIFESHRHGVERVHHDNPPLASKLIVAAVQDLKKRQTPNNATISNTPTPGTTTEPSKPTTSSAVVVPVPVQTTDSQGRSTTVSSSILSEPTASIEVTTTRTNSRGEAQVTTETKPAVIFSTTDSAGRGIETTSAVEFAPTSGQVLTRTDGRGSTFLTTYTPEAGFISSVKLITTTGSDGRQSVITSYTFVDPAATPTDDGSPTNSAGRPGLQTGAALKNRAADVAILGGALGGAFAFFI